MDSASASQDDAEPVTTDRIDADERLRAIWYDEGPAWNGIHDRCVNLKLASDRPQHVYVRALDLETVLDAGDAIQVGTSRKFVESDIERMFALAGFRINRRWFDSRHYLGLVESVRDDAPE